MRMYLVFVSLVLVLSAGCSSLGAIMRGAGQGAQAANSGSNADRASMHCEPSGGLPGSLICR